MMVDSEPKDSWLWAIALSRAASVADPIPLEIPVEPTPPPPVLVELAPAPTAIVELPPPPPPPAPVTMAPDSETTSWIEAREAFEGGHYADALEHYYDILAVRPTHRPSLLNVASCLRCLDRPGEAEAAYQSAVEGVPAPVETSLWLGECLLRTGKYAEAIQAFGKWLEGNPGSGPAILGKAIAFHRLGRLKEAMVWYTAVPPSDEQYPAVLANLIEITAERKDVAKLAEYGAELLKSRRQSTTALAALMQAEMAAGDYKAAMQHGLKLIKFSPGNREASVDSLFNAWFNLGLCYQKTNQVEKAAQAYTEAIKLQSDATPAHFNMGLILQERGDGSGARREFERVLESQPDHALAMLKLAAIHEKEGQGDRAEKLYVRALRDQQQVFDAAFRLGILRLERQDNSGAAEAFERCLLERPGDPAAEINLSLARWRSGDPEGAEAWLHSSQSNNLAPAPVLRLSAALSVEAGDWKAAREIEIRLEALGEDTALLAYNIGVLQQRDGLHSEAAQSFRRASDRKPDFVEAFVNAGHALNESGQTNEAASAWKAAVQANPELAGEYFKTRAASTAV